MSLQSTTFLLSCKRWFVNCLTVKFALPLSDRVFGFEKILWHWGHISLMKVLGSVVYVKFLLNYKICSNVENQTIRISLKYWYKVMLLVLYSGTWRITNLNHTILPIQAFFTDTIYCGVDGNYCCVLKIRIFL